MLPINKQKNSKGKYKIATWNVRSMYQEKLEKVNQEMRRLNIDLLGVSELRWINNGYFNSEETTKYFSGNELMKKNGVAVLVNQKIQRFLLIESFTLD